MKLGHLAVAGLVVLLGALPATAQVAESCTFDEVTATVTAVIAPGGEATLEVVAGEIAFGADPQPCGGATNVNTDTIRIAGHEGSGERPDPGPTLRVSSARARAPTTARTPRSRSTPPSATPPTRSFSSSRRATTTQLPASRASASTATATRTWSSWTLGHPHRGDVPARVQRPRRRRLHQRARAVRRRPRLPGGADHSRGKRQREADPGERGERRSARRGGRRPDRRERGRRLC